MEPTDLTVEILKDIREEMRRSNRVTEEQLSAMRTEMAARFEQVDRRFEQVDRRFEQADGRTSVIETTLRDLSGQMVMYSRALRTLLDRSEPRPCG